MTATVFGATGLIGSTVIELLIADSRFTKVYAAVRKKGVYKDLKVTEVEINYSTLPEFADLLKADVFFSCLGTTIKKAGSKSAQLIVDRDYPIKISVLANQLGVNKIITVSSVGSDVQSNNFYLRTKGEMELGVIENMGANAVFVRPSIIVGNRIENRIGEKIGIYFMRLMSPLLIGKSSKYKPISATTISKAMIASCFISTPQVMYFDDMQMCIN